ncbi:MAG: T9SS type A sorting domain-containing protein [Saprospiraceae bacterium]|nr:T9SS type A sorting domain-containing protein [Saprospiraceae bacterium]
MRNIFPFLLLLLSCSGITQPAQKLVVGYYPGWRWYERNKLVTPATLDYSKYDVLNYAFLNLETDGTLSLTDPWADKNLLLGPINRAVAPAQYDQDRSLGNPAFHKPGKRFSDFAHKNKVRFLVSIGGWAHSGSFSEVAASAAKRAVFASQCNQIVRLYNLDGIDIDWEYPGYPERTVNSGDKQNLTLLLRQVRDSLDAQEGKLKRDLMLTAAFGASPKHMAQVEWPQVSKILDGINLMAYAFYGHWDPVSNHNAPLFPPLNATQSGNSCSEAVQNLLDFGVPSIKINLGLAFYGRTQITAGPAGLHVQSMGCADTVAFANKASTPQYYEIAARLSGYDYRWDEVAQAPYLTGKAGKPSFVSFDDEKSLALKAQFAKSRNLHGVVIWDITADYLETAPGSGAIASTPLAAAIRRALSSASSAVPAVLAGATICVFPNPTPNGYLQIFTNAVDRARTELTLFDTKGQQLHKTTFLEASHRLDLRALPAGPYLVQVRRGSEAPILVRVMKK